MDSRANDFLQTLLNTPSPSGYERPIQDVVRGIRRRLCGQSDHRLARERHRLRKSGRKDACDVRRPLRSDWHAGHADRQ